jgi:hypothetical protein
MVLTREQRRAYDANRRRTSQSRNGARTKARTEHLVQFVGVDGEGVDRPDGAHEYNLLTIGDSSLHHPDGRRLTFDDVAAHLWSYREAHPAAVYVGFYLGYDFAQWLRDIPEERARMLLTTAGFALRKRVASGGNPIPFPVRWGAWEFDLLPNLRRFKLRPSHERHPAARCDWCGQWVSEEPGQRNPHQWLYVCDTGPLFQTSLLKAVNPADWPEPLVTPDEYRVLDAGKRARQGAPVPYGTPVEPATITYNQLENDVLARVLDRYNAGLVAMGVKLTKVQWHGPGQAAQAWLKATAPDHTGDNWRNLGDFDRQPFEAAMASYFGGWFEIPAHGPVPGVVHEYDVNSAYPAIIATLPCLRPGHGVWHWGEGAPPRTRAPYRLVRATVEGNDPYFGAMLHRSPKGRVLRPSGTSGWYWWHELQAAKRADLVSRVRWHEWWEYRPSCDCPPPFRAIADLYHERLRVGKTSPHGRALRLVFNSAYGKMAQSVGEPMFGNPVYASLITAGCRTMILGAIATHPGGTRATMMVATDGVYFRAPHPGLEVNPTKLGAWDTAEKVNLSLFKPGMYWDDKARAAIRSGGKLGIKSRGVNEAALAKVIDRLDSQWERRLAGRIRPENPSWWPATNIIVPFSIVSPRQALNRGRWELCGAVNHDLEALQSADPRGKRNPRPLTGPGNDGLLRTRPWGPQGESAPYDKHFGLELRAMMLDGEAIIPEGDLATLWGELLGIR